MLSSLELRNIIENSFLPQRCQCSQAKDSSLTVRIFDRTSDRVDLAVSGIDSRGLTSSRAISRLIVGLRKDLALSHQRFEAKEKLNAYASL